MTKEVFVSYMKPWINLHSLMHDSELSKYSESDVVREEFSQSLDVITQNVITQDLRDKFFTLLDPQNMLDVTKSDIMNKQMFDAMIKTGLALAVPVTLLLYEVGNVENFNEHTVAKLGKEYLVSIADESRYIERPLELRLDKEPFKKLLDKYCNDGFKKYQREYYSHGARNNIDEQVLSESKPIALRFVELLTNKNAPLPLIRLLNDGLLYQDYKQLYVAHLAIIGLPVVKSHSERAKLVPYLPGDTTEYKPDSIYNRLVEEATCYSAITGENYMPIGVEHEIIHDLREGKWWSGAVRDRVLCVPIPYIVMQRMKKTSATTASEDVHKYKVYEEELRSFASGHEMTLLELLDRVRKSVPDSDKSLSVLELLDRYWYMYKDFQL